MKAPVEIAFIRRNLDQPNASYLIGVKKQWTSISRKPNKAGASSSVLSRSSALSSPSRDLYQRSPSSERGRVPEAAAYVRYPHEMRTLDSRPFYNVSASIPAVPGGAASLVAAHQRVKYRMVNEPAVPRSIQPDNISNNDYREASASMHDPCFA